MKKINIFIGLFAIFSVGCGGGGGGSGEDRAEATTANALEAYSAMSAATYFPSFFKAIYTGILNDGRDREYDCVKGGTVEVKYGTGEKIVEHDFKACHMQAGNQDVLLDGRVYSMHVLLPQADEPDKKMDVLQGFIVKGFLFEAENEVSMVYKAFPFSGGPQTGSDAVKAVLKNNEGSFFTVADIGKSESISIHTVYNESKYGLGKIKYIGTFINAVDMSMEEGRLTAVVAGPLTAVDNYFYPTDFFDNDSVFDRMEIRLDSGKYFTGIGEEDDEPDIPDGFVPAHGGGEGETILVGKDRKFVEVWQDSSGTVFAKSGDDYETSFTTLTPSFAN